MAGNQNQDEDIHEGIRNLIERGAEIAGGGFSGIAGTAAGLLLGGPEGVFLGGTLGSSAAIALRLLGAEMSSRLLGPREQQRIGYVYALAASEISERIQGGEEVRQDGFFNINDRDRSDATEVWESVLMKSQREPEELKLPYMAHLLSNLAFDSRVGVNMAHQLTNGAESLRYRQLCILKLSACKDRFALREGDYRGQDTYSIELLQVLYEYVDLYKSGFINFENVAFGPPDIKPGMALVQGHGVELYNLMQLWEIPDDELTPIAAILS